MKEWSMPKWMEPYRKFIVNTGGNEIEELVNDDYSTFSNNYMKTALIIAVRSQIDFLGRLKDSGLLKNVRDKK